MTICGLSSQHCQQFSIYQDSHLCADERKLEASVENLPISNHFRASSGQIVSDGGQDNEHTAALLLTVLAIDQISYLSNDLIF